jgi:tetratricopeptide (TPR) repeat protein
MMQYIKITISIIIIQSGFVYGQQYVNQQGRALDANLRLGSKGINSSYRWESLNRSTQLMTGNIGLGRSFKGIVPYGSQFGLSRGISASLNTLDNFKRDSVSGDSLSSSGIQNPQPFYSNTTVSRHTGGLNYKIKDQYRVDAAYGGKNRSQNKVHRVLSIDNYRPLSVNNGKNSSNLQLLPFTLNEIDAIDRFDQTAPQTVLGNRLNRSALLMNDNTERFKNTKTVNKVDGEIYESFYLDLTPKPSEKEVIPDKKTNNVFYNTNVDKGNTLKNENINDDIHQPINNNVILGTKMPSVTFGSKSLSTTPKMIMKNTKAFNKAMKQGEIYMHVGQYYKAADSYDLAGTFAKNHPLQALAKSHSLFGAGEYLSSAFFLNQAFTLSPKLSQRKFKLPAILSEDGVITERLTELDQYIDRTNHPMLFFLRGYIAIQQNDLNLAKETLDKALTIQPDTKAIELLLESITNDQ